MPQAEEKGHEKHQISGESAGRVLYGGAHSMAEIAHIIEGDIEIKSTELTEEYTVDDYAERHPERIPLFISTANGRLRFPIDQEKMTAGVGSVITALVPARPLPADGDEPDAGEHDRNVGES